MTDPNSTTDLKEKLRRHLAENEDSAPSETAGWGRAAEHLRRIGSYRSAGVVMVSPVIPLRQVCLNVLTDRKLLILPTPGVQKGFLRIDPKQTPPQKRNLAINSGQRNPWATKIPYGSVLVPPIDLIVTHDIAATADGSRIGDGHGHMDLQCAILKTLSWLSPKLLIVTVVADDRFLEQPIPMEPTDIRADLVLTPVRSIRIDDRPRLIPEIVWGKLDSKSIRRNDALHFLHHRSSSDSQGE